MNTKKILSLIVALAMIVTAVPMFGLVASAAEITSGSTITYGGIPYKVVSNNLITNGDFSDSWNGWTQNNGGGTFDTANGLASGAYTLVEDEDDENSKVLKISGTLNNYIYYSPTQSGGSDRRIAVPTTYWDGVESGKTYYIAFDALRNGGESGKTNYVYYGAYANKSWAIPGSYGADFSARTDAVATGNLSSGNYLTEADTWTTISTVIEATADGYFGFQWAWIQDYTYVEIDNFVAYEIERIPATITVNFLDESGNAIADSVPLEGTYYAGDSYTYDTSKDVVITVADGTTYVLDTTKTNATIDSLEETNTINLYYTADTPQSVADVNVTTRVGVLPVLPATVDAIGSSGSTITDLPVTWDENTAPTTTDSYTITGHLTDFTSVTVTANVTVKYKEDYLIVKYDFDGDLTDSSDNGYDAALTGDAEYVSGISGSAIKLPGTSNTSGYITLPDAATEAIMDAADEGGFTVTTYVKKTAAQNQFLFSMHGTEEQAYERAFGLIDSMGNTSLRFEGTKDYNAITPTRKVPTTASRGAADENYVAITMTVSYSDGLGDLRFYVDGEDVTDTANGTELTNGKIDFTPRNVKEGSLDSLYTFIGLSPYDGDNSYAGCLDEFAIYSVALTADEVKDMLAAKRTVTVNYYTDDAKQNKVESLTASKTVFEGDTAEFDAVAYSDDGVFYSADAVSYTVTKDEEYDIVLTVDTTKQFPAADFSYNFTTGEVIWAGDKNADASKKEATVTIGWTNLRETVMAFKLPQEEGTEILSANLNLTAFFSDNAGNSFEVYAFEPKFVDIENATMTGLGTYADYTNQADLIKDIGAVKVGDGTATTGGSYTISLDLSGVQSLIADGTLALYLTTSHQIYFYSATTANYPYLSDVVPVKVPTLSAKLGYDETSDSFTIAFLFDAASTVDWDVTLTTKENEQKVTVPAGQDGLNVTVDSNVAVKATLGDNEAQAAIYALVTDALKTGGFGSELLVKNAEAVNTVINHGDFYTDSEGNLTEEALKIMDYDKDSKTVTLKDDIYNAGVRIKDGDNDGKSKTLDDDEVVTTDAEEYSLLAVELVYEPVSNDAVADADVEAALDFGDIY